MIFLPDLDLVPDRFGGGAALSLGNAADGTDNALTGAVDFGDAKTHGLVKKLGQLCLAGQVGLARRDEHTDAGDVHNNAALVLLSNRAFEDRIALNGIFHVIPCLGGIQTALGQHRGAFHIVYTDNNRFDRIADLDGILNLHPGFGELRRRNKAGILGAEINADFRPGDRHDGSAYLLAIIYGLQGLFQHFVEAELLLYSGSFCNSFCCLFCGLCLCRLRNRCFRCRGLFLDFFDSDFVTHFVYYLLNDPRRR